MVCPNNCEGVSLCRYDEDFPRCVELTSPPTKVPTKFPTSSPTKFPTSSPTKSPTDSPTKFPTRSPTKFPTKSPTKVPISSPIQSPIRAPRSAPTMSPRRPRLSDIYDVNTPQINRNDPPINPVKSNKVSAEARLNHLQSTGIRWRIKRAPWKTLQETGKRGRQRMKESVWGNGRKKKTTFRTSPHRFRKHRFN